MTKTQVRGPVNKMTVEVGIKSVGTENKSRKPDDLYRVQMHLVLNENWGTFHWIWNHKVEWKLQNICLINPTSEIMR